MEMIESENEKKEKKIGCALRASARIYREKTARKIIKKTKHRIMKNITIFFAADAPENHRLRMVVMPL